MKHLQRETCKVLWGFSAGRLSSLGRAAIKEEALKLGQSRFCLEVE